MNISKAALGFLVAGMVAGAGGAYVATRSDTAATGLEQPGSLATAPVEQSETIVNEFAESAPVAEAAPTPAPAPAPARVSVKPVSRPADRPRDVARATPSRPVESPSVAESSRPA